MHIKLILKLLSLLAMLFTIFMIPSYVISLYTGDSASSSFLISIFLLALPSGFIYWFVKDYRSNLTIRGVFFLVTIAWISISAYSAIPFMLAGTFEDWATCFFEATSGITTTGATAMTDIEANPPSILFWRSTTHWLGGVGIVVLSVALIPLLGVGGTQLFRAEATGVDGMDSDKITPRIAQTAKYIWIVYFVLTFISFILLRIGGMTSFDAVNHAMSALASGGFSTKNLSIGYYNSPYIDWVIVLSMLFAGINFTLIVKLFSRKINVLFKSTEFRWYILIIIIFGFCITFINYSNNQFETFHDSLRHSFFQTLSLMTSTGFSTIDYEFWPFSAQYLLFMLMFIGGCTGSTAGGFKVIRLAILFKQALNEIRYIIHPRGIFILRINDHPVKKEIVYSVFGFLFLYIATAGFTSFIMSFEYDLLTSITAGFAMVGNVGPGFGAIGPADNYGHAPDYVKYTLSIAMLMGRLEIYTFFALVTPYFWRKFK